MASLLVLYSVFDYLYFYNGALYFPHIGENHYISKAEGKNLYIDQGNGFELFDLKGVNLGIGKPGYYATEYAVEKEEYLRWFRQIQDMGANVIRVYVLSHSDFYEAFYEYNCNNPNPLYLLHGVWVDDYLINSRYSALDEEFHEPFIDSCKDVVDVIHGRFKSRGSNTVMSQTYDKDISPWVYGYILGVEWEDTLVAYTDKYVEQAQQYQGKYFYTENASNFEIFLADVGETVASYETRKYGQQRVIAFSNWATTDPFRYPEKIEQVCGKKAAVDMEHIKCTDSFVPGQFASYHIYPYYPDYYSYFENHEYNTYRQYLREINDYHSIPVVISEFGVSSGRGMAAYEENLNRNQGFMSEQQQGEALVSMYQDIKQTGCAGGLVFSWQDEWFKRTWNTMASSDLNNTAYWSDYQTNEQYFGLLSFDPGKKTSICYVDGNRSDWTEEDVVTQQDGYRLSMKYDEKFIYFLAEQKGFSLANDKLYIPVDVTPKSGAMTAENLGVSMSEAADFVIEINGGMNSRVWVQERYDTARALYYGQISGEWILTNEIPEKDSSTFHDILLRLNRYRYYERNEEGGSTEVTFEEYDTIDESFYLVMKTYETGKLTYGNANPSSPDFNSLADFCAGEGFVEIKLPWQLLNFADPTTMRIHDDYYECYGVEYLSIDSIRVGVGDGEETIQMADFPMEKLGRTPEYHERLKESYYILQDYWTDEPENAG